MNDNEKQGTAICCDGKNLPPSCEIIVPDVKAVDSVSKEEYNRTERKNTDLPPSCSIK